MRPWNYDGHITGGDAAGTTDETGFRHPNEEYMATKPKPKALTLYDLTAEVAELRDMLLADDHDDHEAVEEALTEVLDGLVPAKVAGYCSVLAQWSGECDMLDVEIKRLQAHKSARKNAAVRLKGRLLDAMMALDVTTVDAGTFKVRRQATAGRVEVTAVDSLPDALKTTTITVKPDKAAIAKALKAGEVVPGALLLSGQTVRIR